MKGICIRLKRNVLHEFASATKLKKRLSQCTSLAQSYRRKHLLRLGYNILIFNIIYSRKKMSNEQKSAEYLSYSRKRRYFQAMNNNAIVRKEKRAEIINSFKNRNRKLVKMFINKALYEHVQTKFIKPKEIATEKKLFSSWQNYIFIKLTARINLEKKAQKASLKVNELKQKQFFSIWIEYHRKSFTSKLFKAKYLQFHRHKVYKKAFLGFYWNRNKQAINKMFISKAILNYKHHLKRASFSHILEYHQSIQLKRILIIKAIKYWARKRILLHFDKFKAYFKAKILKREEYKEARHLRKMDLQNSTIKKWLKAGIYWSEKQDNETRILQAKREEKIWKIVQKAARIWLSKIKRSNIVSEKRPISIRTEFTSQDPQEIVHNIKPRPPPRRLNDQYLCSKNK